MSYYLELATDPVLFYKYLKILIKKSCGTDPKCKWKLLQNRFKIFVADL